MTIEEKLEKVLRHMELVRNNCVILGKKLMKSHDNKNKEEGLYLIQLGHLHDNSKLTMFELENLWPNEELYTEALSQHRNLNMHHPEAWKDIGGINAMDNVYIAEMVCDCTARAQEFGSDIRKWFHEEAKDIYGITEETKQKIDYYLDLLLVKKFVHSLKVTHESFNIADPHNMLIVKLDTDKELIPYTVYKLLRLQGITEEWKFKSVGRIPGNLIFTKP